MKQPWDADVEITLPQAARLIAKQFPALAPVQLVAYGTGWDNVAFLASQRAVFRFPRRALAAPLLAREARILPWLAPQLPVPVPLPQYWGEPAEGYPYAFAGYTLLPGQTACRCKWSDHERTQQAPVLARFLASLHRIPVEAETLRWAPRDEIDRANVQQRAPKLRERLQALGASLGKQTHQALLQLVEKLAGTPLHTRPHCWVHGDFYARHLLYDRRGLSGVIDWGDVHVGDPALDLAIAFSFLPPAGRGVFRQAYGEIDKDTWQRARFRALHYGVVLTEYGAHVGDIALRAAGEYALQSVWKGGQD